MNRSVIKIKYVRIRKQFCYLYYKNIYFFRAIKNVKYLFGAEYVLSKEPNGVKIIWTKRADYSIGICSDHAASESFRKISISLFHWFLFNYSCVLQCILSNKYYIEKN